MPVLYCNKITIIGNDKKLPFIFLLFTEKSASHLSTSDLLTYKLDNKWMMIIIGAIPGRDQSGQPRVKIVHSRHAFTIITLSAARKIELLKLKLSSCSFAISKFFLLCRAVWSVCHTQWSIKCMRVTSSRWIFLSFLKWMNSESFRIHRRFRIIIATMIDILFPMACSQKFVLIDGWIDKR